MEPRACPHPLLPEFGGGGAELFVGDRAHRLIAGHVDDIAAWRLTVVIDRTFGLADATAAHAYIEGHAALGRFLRNP